MIGFFVKMKIQELLIRFLLGEHLFFIFLMQTKQP